MPGQSDVGSGEWLISSPRDRRAANVHLGVMEAHGTHNTAQGPNPLFPLGPEILRVLLGRDVPPKRVCEEFKAA